MNGVFTMKWGSVVVLVTIVTVIIGVAGFMQEAVLLVMTVAASAMVLSFRQASREEALASVRFRYGLMYEAVVVVAAAVCLPDWLELFTSIGGVHAEGLSPLSVAGYITIGCLMLRFVSVNVRLVHSRAFGVVVHERLGMLKLEAFRLHDSDCMTSMYMESGSTIPLTQEVIRTSVAKVKLQSKIALAIAVALLYVSAVTTYEALSSHQEISELFSRLVSWLIFTSFGLWYGAYSALLRLTARRTGALEQLTPYEYSLGQQIG